MWIGHILGYKVSQQIQENWNNILYFIKPQCNKIRNQQKEKLQKIYKHMDIEQYTFEWTEAHQRNKGEKQKIPRIKWEWKYNLPELLGHSKGNAKRKVYSYVPALKK
jgi:hypothetical protein